MFLVGIAVTVVCLIVLASASPNSNRLGTIGQWLVVGSLFVYMAAFSLSLGPVSGLIVSEIYPQRVRGVAMGVVIVANWVSQIITAFTFPGLVASLGAAGDVLDSTPRSAPPVFCSAISSCRKRKVSPWKQIERIGAPAIRRAHGRMTLLERRANHRAMQPRLSILTLGVRDLNRSIAFYRDGLGLALSPQSNELIAYLPLRGLWLALFPIESLSLDTRIPLEQFGRSPIAWPIMSRSAHWSTRLSRKPSPPAAGSPSPRPIRTGEAMPGSLRILTITCGRSRGIRNCRYDGHGA